MCYTDQPFREEGKRVWIELVRLDFPPQGCREERLRVITSLKENSLTFMSGS
jgi:hypothetical protein